MNFHILIVEDEPKIGELLADYFRHAGFRASRFERGDLVEAFVAREKPDLLVLDLQLPGKDGLDVCRDLRSAGQALPILMLTARVDEVDRLIGLELGADDYICKPFSPREVVARARAVLRRVAPTVASERLVLGRVAIDRGSYSASVDGQPLALTPLEFDLLHALLRQPGRVWSRAQLLAGCRGSDYAGYERNIDTHIKNLRRKLRGPLDGGDAIRSVYGVGYSLDTEVISPAS